MRFTTLLNACADVLRPPGSDAEVTSPVSEDNRRVQPGGLFVAVKGQSVDGHDRIPDAIQRGAVAVVGQRPPDQVTCGVPYAQVADARMAIGRLAAAYYGYPARDLVIVGVTGTDGKTSTTALIYNILKASGRKVGMISTVSAIIGDEELPTGLHVTTPGADEIQGYLRRMVDAGLHYCVLETTSFGLAQGRVNGVDYDVAVLTNLTHEHLNIHGTFEHYRQAKGILFDMLATSYPKQDIVKTAVVNADDPNAWFFLCKPATRQFTYSISDPSVTAYASHTAFHPDRTDVRVQIQDQTLGLSTGLVGRFNVENILAATCVGVALDCSADAIQAGIELMSPVPGRMERIDEGQNFLAVVDFAHTPNALKRALEAARLMLPTDRKVIAVFGSAGLRDYEKRWMMAEVSAELADITVLTAEDPRTEALDKILEEMLTGALRKGAQEGETVYRVPDRGAALAFACKLARPGDMVIACGKGHEQSMCFGTVEYPWDDRAALRAALRGAPLRTLPTAT
jgi:UDP-N-acetylmuramoyl-L-alanyl-D-glutamate--2,6-diaminopimelate ligase